MLCVLLSVWACTLPVEIDKQASGFRVNSNPITANFDAWKQARKYSTDLNYPNSTKIKIDTNDEDNMDQEKKRRILDISLNNTQREFLGSLQLLYISPTEDENFNVFTEDHLQRIHEIEDIIRNSPGFDQFCKKRIKKTSLTIKGEITLPEEKWVDECEPPISIINFFYPSRNYSEPRKYQLYDVADFDGKGPLYDVATITNFFVYVKDLQQLIDRKFSIWFQRSRVAFSRFSFGWPLPGYNDTTGPLAIEQKSKFEIWIRQFHDILPSLSYGDMQVAYEGTTLLSWEVDLIVYSDILFATGSVLFVFVWLIIHSRSILLSVAGLTHILLSIPSGFFVIRVILDNDQVNLLMCMVLFIIVGIGCDDIFIILDAWRQSFLPGQLPPGTPLVKQMDRVYRQSISTMFVTSITTAASFWTNSLSPIIPIRVFGIFIGSIVMVNFFLVMTWYPAIIILWHQHCAKRCNFFTWCTPSYLTTKGTTTEQGYKDTAIHDDESREEGQGKEDSMGTTSLLNDDDTTVEVPDDDPSESDVPSGSDVPSSGSDVPSSGSDVPSSGSDVPSSGSDVPLSGSDVPSGSDVRPASAPLPGSLPSPGTVFNFDDNIENYNIFEKYLLKIHIPILYKLRYGVLVVSLLLLIGGTVVGLNVTVEQGEPQFFKKGHNIYQLQETWNNILPQTSSHIYSIVFGIETIDRKGYNVYNPKAIGRTVWKSDFDPSTPAAQLHIIDTYQKLLKAKFNDRDLAKQRTTHKHCFMCNFQVWYEKQKNGNKFPITDQSEFYKNLKIFLNTDDGEIFRDDLGWNNVEFEKQKLRYCVLYFEGNADMEDFSMSDKELYYGTFESNIKAQNLIAPPEVSGAYVTDGAFVFMVTVSALIKTAFFGTLSSLFVSAIVLVVATMNVILSLYSILSIILILMILMCFLFVTGGTFGMIESIVFTIVVGLSVDYAVHISIAYLNQIKKPGSENVSRITLVKATAAEIGSAILGGAITTSSSVFMLFFCQITFFGKFGQFVFVNIVASFIVTFTFLLTMLLVIGPRGNTGDVKYMIKYVVSLFCKKKTPSHILLQDEGKEVVELEQISR